MQQKVSPAAVAALLRKAGFSRSDGAPVAGFYVRGTDGSTSVCYRGRGFGEIYLDEDDRAAQMAAYTATLRQNGYAVTRSAENRLEVTRPEPGKPVRVSVDWTSRREDGKLSGIAQFHVDEAELARPGLTPQFLLTKDGRSVHAFNDYDTHHQWSGTGTLARVLKGAAAWMGIPGRELEVTEHDETR